MQCHHTVASRCIGFGIGRRGGTGGVRYSVPSELIAGSLCLDTRVAVSYGEIQRIHIGTGRPRQTVVIGINT